MTFVINVDTHAILYIIIYDRGTNLDVHSQQTDLKTLENVIVII